MHSEVKDCCFFVVRQFDSRWLTTIDKWRIDEIEMDLTSTCLISFLLRTISSNILSVINGTQSECAFILFLVSARKHN